LLALAGYIPALLGGGSGPEYLVWLAVAFAVSIYPAVNLLALVLPGTPRRPSWDTNEAAQVTKKVCRVVAIGLNVVALVVLTGSTAEMLGGGIDPVEWDYIVMAPAYAVYPAVNLLALLLPDTRRRPL